MGKGKRDKLSRGDLAGFFMKKGGLKPDDVGTILVFPDYSYVAVKMNRMREVLKNIVCCFEDADKAKKAIRKASTLPALEEAAQRLFTGYALRETPGFIPEKRHAHSTTSF